jgi:uncharacterized repeat protein (TIGR03943 family)
VGAAARAFLLLGLGGLVCWNLASGQVHLYVNEHSVWLVALTLPFLLAMAATAWRRSSVGRERLSQLAVALPIALVVLVPARPLGSAALAALDAGAPASALDARQPASATSSPWPLELTAAGPGAAMLTWDLRLLERLRVNDPELRGLEGAPASLVGFVHRTPSLPSDQLLVGRFMVRCCAADAVPITFPVRYAGAAELPIDAWVEVEGPIRYAGADGARMPFVEASAVRLVPQPARPYLYP